MIPLFAHLQGSRIQADLQREGKTWLKLHHPWLAGWGNFGSWHWIGLGE